ncbi:hypothetical protein Mnod_2961 [Methylobacterium nodulans ORS 2060]|uniref:Uncharacterized protein n=1 Tax=Methylobacterium nodulans (strain LMG 21967 / CNCM I-2342 / ORS 2060) TaxID=460265 RepID=B8II42_METNO|nr:hypothetical protein Mnod_2961 [Methylobacterium nodulans ORS 2060]
MRDMLAHYAQIHAPLQPWFDKTWKPGDFELVN